MAVLFGLIWEVYRNEGFEVVDVTYEESEDYLLYVENTGLTGETAIHRNFRAQCPKPVRQGPLEAWAVLLSLLPIRRIQLL
jgi:hypothetical protein